MNQMSIELDYLLRDDPANEKLVVEYLVQSYYAMLYRLGLHVLQQHDDAEDAAQEAIMAASNKIDQYQPGTQLKAWVYTIGLNVCRAKLRKRKWRNRLKSALLVSGETAVHSHPSAEEQFSKDARNANLWQAINQLKEKQRLPIILRYGHGLSIREIGEVLDIKEGTVRSRLHYAQRELLILLREQA